MAGFEDLTGNPLFQIGLPLAEALTSAILPNRGARAVQALNSGLGIANAYSQQQQKDQKEKLLSQKLGDVFKGQTVTPAATLPGATTNLGLASEEAAGLQSLNNEGQPSEATAASADMIKTPPQPFQIAPAVTKSKFSPEEQTLGQALIDSGYPGLAATMAQKVLEAKPDKPVVAGPGHAVLDPTTYQPMYTVPNAPPREVTPPRPVIGEHGTMIPTRNPQTGQWEWPTQVNPSLPAPARELAPEERILKGAETKAAEARSRASDSTVGVNRARIGEINQKTQKLKTELDDPKATTEKLTTEYNAVLRGIKQINDQGDYLTDPAVKDRLDKLTELAGRYESAFAEKRGLPGTTPPPGGSPKTLDKTTAAQILKEVGGDKDKARALARQRGYQF